MNRNTWAVIIVLALLVIFVSYFAGVNSKLKNTITTSTVAPKISAEPTKAESTPSGAMIPTTEANQTITPTKTPSPTITGIINSNLQKVINPNLKIIATSTPTPTPLLYKIPNIIKK